MLPDAERLRRDSLFKRAYTGRKSVSTPLVTLYVLPRQPRSAPRLPLVGMVIGKKVHNLAVRRNRAKRRVREAYRLIRASQPSLKQWYAMVWVLQSKVLTATWEEVCQAVQESIVMADKKYGKKIS